MSNNEIAAEEVLRYLSESDTEKPVLESKPAKKRGRKKKAPAKTEEPSVQAPVELKSADEALPTDAAGATKIELQADESFGEEATEARDIILSIRKNATDIPVTKEDIIEYQLSVLDDKPVHLEIGFMNGRKAVVRALNVYEEDLVWEAVRHIVDEEQVATALVPTYVQQVRMTMQLIRFDDKPMDYLTFEYESGKRKEHVLKLHKASQERFMYVSAPRYKMMCVVLDVFESKIAKLHSEALSETFWDPVSTD